MDHTERLFRRAESGDLLEEADVRQLLSRRTAESLHLDYKSGRLLQPELQNAAKLRKAVSGFANSDGGLLLLGINGGDSAIPEEERWSVDGTPSRVGNQSPLEWVHHALSQFAGRLHPPPSPDRSPIRLDEGPKPL